MVPDTGSLAVDLSGLVGVGVVFSVTSWSCLIPSMLHLDLGSFGGQVKALGSRIMIYVVWEDTLSCWWGSHHWEWHCHEYFFCNSVQVVGKYQRNVHIFPKFPSRTLLCNKIISGLNADQCVLACELQYPIGLVLQNVLYASLQSLLGSVLGYLESEVCSSCDITRLPVLKLCTQRLSCLCSHRQLPIRLCGENLRGVISSLFGCQTSALFDQILM